MQIIDLMGKVFAGFDVVEQYNEFIAAKPRDQVVVANKVSSAGGQLL